MRARLNTHPAVVSLFTAPDNTREHELMVQIHDIVEKVDNSITEDKVRGGSGEHFVIPYAFRLLGMCLQ